MNDCMELCRECECVELTASDSDAAVLCAVDIDECATLRGICINGRCRNTVGSFICLCQPGYYYNDERLICDGTYSQSRPCQLHSVRPSGSRHVWVLRCVVEWDVYWQENEEMIDWFVIDSSCVTWWVTVDVLHTDIDECARSDICHNGQCVNSPGSFQCLCRDGYQLGPTADHCEGLHHHTSVSACLCVCVSRVITVKHWLQAVSTHVGYSVGLHVISMRFCFHPFYCHFLKTIVLYFEFRNCQCLKLSTWTYNNVNKLL